MGQVCFPAGWESPLTPKVEPLWLVEAPKRRLMIEAIMRPRTGVNHYATIRRVYYEAPVIAWSRDCLARVCQWHELPVKEKLPQRQCEQLAKKIELLREDVYRWDEDGSLPFGKLLRVLRASGKTSWDLPALGSALDERLGMRRALSCFEFLGQKKRLPRRSLVPAWRYAFARTILTLPHRDVWLLECLSRDGCGLIDLRHALRRSPMFRAVIETAAAAGLAMNDPEVPPGLKLAATQLAKAPAIVGPEYYTICEELISCWGRWQIAWPCIQASLEGC